MIALSIAVFTKAVVAICVVFVPALAVVDFGVPVNVGEAVFAILVELFVQLLELVYI